MAPVTGRAETLERLSDDSENFVRARTKSLDMRPKGLPRGSGRGVGWRFYSYNHAVVLIDSVLPPLLESDHKTSKMGYIYDQDAEVTD